jgi:hypothetical protein
MIRRQHGAHVFVWFNKLQDTVAEDALTTLNHEHTCTDECDPPTEERLIEFFKSLSEEQRVLVHFMMHLNKQSYHISTVFWRKPPVELRPKES